MKTAYEVLGVHASSTEEEINGMRKTLARLLHPDRLTGDAAAMAEVNAAHALLTDPQAVKRYRAELKTHFPKVCTTCGGAGCTTKQKGFTKKIVTRCKTCQGVGLTS